MEKSIEVIVLGEENVGKTEIINNLIIKRTKNEINENHNNKEFEYSYFDGYIPNECQTTIDIEENNVMKSKNLKIYKIPARKYSSVNKSFLRSANIALLVFNITNIDSFFELYDWDELFNEEKNLLKCVIANKKDLIKERKISEEDGKRFAKKIGAFYYEINSCNNNDISDLFSKIMKTYVESYEEIQKKTIHLKEKKDEKKKEGGCCSGSGSFSMDTDILYHLKFINSKKDKNNIIRG